jgi:hypothetical protein
MINVQTNQNKTQLSDKQQSLVHEKLLSGVIILSHVYGIATIILLDQNFFMV